MSFSKESQQDTCCPDSQLHAVNKDLLATGRKGSSSKTPPSKIPSYFASFLESQTGVLPALNLWFPLGSKKLPKVRPKMLPNMEDFFYWFSTNSSSNPRWCHTVAREEEQVSRSVFLGLEREKSGPQSLEMCSKLSVTTNSQPRLLLCAALTIWEYKTIKEFISIICIIFLHFAPGPVRRSSNGVCSNLNSWNLKFWNPNITFTT